MDESADERLRQATCAIIIGSQVRGTAWLLNREGLLLTAGHVLGESNPLDQVQVRFPEDVPHDAYKIVWFYQSEAGVDFAVLKMSNPPDGREPLPISLDREVTGEFGCAVTGAACWTSRAASARSSAPSIRRTSPRCVCCGCVARSWPSPVTAAAVFLDESNAVVGLQTEAAQATTGAGRDTVLAMPLYRIAPGCLGSADDHQQEPLGGLGEAALSSLTPLLTPSSDRDCQWRFVIRREQVRIAGLRRAAAWDPDYIPLDADSTDIFYNVRYESLESIAGGMADRFDRGSLDTFIDLCRSIDLVDEEGKFTGKYIDNIPLIGQLSAPLRIYLSCTRACNFSRQHCYSSSGNPYPDELTTGEIKRLMEEMAAMGTFELSIGGGEPLVRVDWPAVEVIGHANSLDISVLRSTNAVAATPAMVDSLRSVNLASIKVSMEGASAAVSDAIRGEPGSLQAALRGLANLCELRVPIYLHRVFMRPNAGETQALIKLAEQMGATMVIFDTVMPVGRAAAHPELILDPEETSRLSDEVQALRKTTRVDLQTRRQVPFDVGSRRCGWVRLQVREHDLPHRPARERRPVERSCKVSSMRATSASSH